MLPEQLKQDLHAKISDALGQLDMCCLDDEGERIVVADVLTEKVEQWLKLVLNGDGRAALRLVD